MGGQVIEGSARLERNQANAGETEGGRTLDWWWDGLIMGLYAAMGPSKPTKYQAPGAPVSAGGGGLVAEPGSRSPPNHGLNLAALSHLHLLLTRRRPTVSESTAIRRCCSRENRVIEATGLGRSRVRILRWQAESLSGSSVKRANQQASWLLARW